MGKTFRRIPGDDGFKKNHRDKSIKKSKNEKKKRRKIDDIDE